MNKKVLIILVVCILVIGGALGFWFYKHKSSETQSNNSSTSKSSSHSAEWNPYATEEHHQVTLSDQLLSAGNGDYVVKMNVTIDFVDDEAYYKFEGYKTLKEGEKAGSSEESSSSDTATPMELKINDSIGELMMNANEEQLKNRDTLKVYLKDGINRKLDLDHPVVKELYIENYILQ